MRGILAAVDRYDAAAVVGLGLICWGLWAIYPPAAGIGAGGLLVIYAVVGARNEGGQ